MKTHWIIAILTVASAGTSALAADVYQPAPSAEEGTVLRTDLAGGAVDRAKVEDDVLAARRDGTLTNISRGYGPRFPFWSPPVSTKTREQVEQEFHTSKTQPTTPDGRRMVPGVGLVDRMGP